MNSRRMNRLEELGRVDAEKAFTKKGKRNLRDEKSRIVRELKAKGGKVKKKKENPMKEDRAKEGKKAQYRKMGFGKMMDKGEIKFADGGYITKKKKPSWITKKETKPKYITKKKKYITKKTPQQIQERERVKSSRGYKMGGSLKEVQPSQKGLKKLPTKVRNKMGYMKKGGRVGMGKAMRGGGCVR